MVKAISLLAICGYTNGLGRRDNVDLIEIHWPDGQLEPVRDIQVDHLVVVEEGKGVTKISVPKLR